ncbi:substrate-binding domain-containing protein [Corynebacterium glucuronolyticum]|uniref:Substrate-binding domain-containing protein n=1 Tax=Corynebacterium glucuronolyticum TaxID=39791 RepID=A0A7T4EG82_9CORY|nr:substrate-binding domain-containing protein [Corynebacterium glucuronolyticum]MCT1563195.1 substrate-binding domain-containing protein [Corynebacterium glucuronolyticum]QQB46812.1 substrate-binding domain-containing protein [Corynebacterium glucuronolyticum]WKD62348.1 D-ribose-binding periplasmic protein precursor [Corynebacterium glucuronolyticum DSM 44120]SMB86865.1 monosaccharide ABC transporter substrate-binding protein, CUT2 family (TC 3.A.1.2.-) [Corynebacterium glucuronolyticum]
MLRKSLVLLTAGMLTLSGCSATPRDVPAAGSRAVTLALSTEKNPFFLQVRYGAQAKANELGIDLTVLDAGDDAEVQAAQLDDVSSGVAVVNPADSEALAPAVSQLNEKGIPAITVDRTITGADVAALIDSNNTEGGAAAASVLAKAIRAQGEVIVLRGIEGSSSSAERYEGFTQAMAEHPRVRIVAAEAADFDRDTARDLVTDLLADHPDVAGIFAENDEMALGAVDALGERAGKDVKVVGFDGTEEGVRAVKNRKLVATIAQQSSELGATAIEQAGKLLDGEAAESVHTPVMVVTRDNIEKYRPL